jgi:hypothetical protein
VKITSVVAGMVAGADSIDDLGVIGHGALPGLFGGIRAPSTLGTFLRGFTWGNVRQLDAVARETLTGLSRNAPLLPGTDQYAFLDVDSTISRVYGYAKQGADYGYTRVRGLHPLLATISTPIAAPVIAGTRLRRGSAGSAKGAASFVAEAISTARAAGATGVLLARMDSAFDSHAVVSTCLRAGVRFSITTKQTRPVRAAIETITEHAWVPIAYPQAIYDEASQQWISDAEIAETTYTAFTSRRKSEQITLRLIVRRVKDKNVVPGQGELFTAWRYHAFITDSTLQLVAAEKQHREHAIIEQVNADLKDSALAHMPWRILRRERGLAGARRDRPQPHPRRWLPGQPLSRQSPHRHAAPPPDHRTRPHRPTIPPHHPPPPAQLATPRRLHRPVHRHPRPTTHSLTRTNTAPPGPTGDATVEKLDRPAVFARSQPHNKIHNPNTTHKMITQS